MSVVALADLYLAVRLRQLRDVVLQGVTASAVPTELDTEESVVLAEGLASGPCRGWIVGGEITTEEEDIGLSQDRVGDSVDVTSGCFAVNVGIRKTAVIGIL